MLRPLLIAAALLLFPASALGHALGITHVTATFGADGTYTVDVEAHPTPLGAAQRIPDLFGEDKGVIVALRPDDGGGGTDGEAHAALADSMLVGLFERDRPVRFDGVAHESTVTLAEPAEDGTPVVRLTGRVPDGADIFRWHAPRELGLARVRASTPSRESAMDQWVEAGTPTNPLVFAAAAPTEASTPGFGTWVAQGFLHIVPQGLDHVLFVLALFLFGAALRPLLVQVTAFTVAHSVTLGLAVGGVARLPPGLVEPLIALSVAFVAFENLRPRPDDSVPRHRTVVVLAFGLLHGAGFAGALEALGLPTGDRLAAVLGFNVGVELGQLAVIAAAAGLVGWARSRPWYRSRVEVPGSLAIGIVGIVWTVQRVLEGAA